jgi:hypothetical protein
MKVSPLSVKVAVAKWFATAMPPTPPTVRVRLWNLYHSIEKESQVMLKHAAIMSLKQS